MRTASSARLRHILLWVCAATPFAAVVGSCTYGYEDAWRCTNGRKDRGETDVDCGGSCVRENGSQVGGLCALSRTCAEDADCDRTLDEAGVPRATCVDDRCVTTRLVGAWQQVWGVESGTFGPSRRMAAGFAMHGDLGLLFGGLENETALDDGFVFDAVAEDWDLRTKKPNGPGPRYLLTTVDIPDTERTWVLPGCRKTDPLDPCGVGEAARTVVAYHWVNRAWDEDSPAPLLPEQRIAAGAAIDSKRRELVVHGGAGSSLAPTGELLTLSLSDDGLGVGDWERISPSGGGPSSPRFESPLVYMEAQQFFVLFGGSKSVGGKGGLADTWIYRPQGDDGREPSWEDHTEAVRPTARTAHAMAYNADRHTAVLFGGRQDEGTADGSQDTWEFDGEAWREVVTVGQLPWTSFNNAMVFDAARHRMLLYVGGSHFGAVEQKGNENKQYSHSQVWSFSIVGTPCEVDTDCGSQHCVERVCCESACEVGVCNGLDVPGACQVD